MSVTDQPRIDPESIIQPGENVVWAIQEDEIAWCQEHPEAPEARRVTRLHDLVQRGKIPTDSKEWVEAIVALRAVRPRQILKVENLFLYVFYDPFKQQERLIISQPSYDLVHARSLISTYRDIQKQVPHTMSLKRFRYERTVPFEKIRYLRSRNEQSRRAEEVFAFIGPAPGGPGDEMVLGSFSAKTMQPKIYLHANAENIKEMLPEVQDFLKKGLKVELRHFVRDGDVNDLEFSLREAGRA